MRKSLISLCALPKDTGTVCGKPTELATLYREQKPHHGIVLLRLEDERAVSKIEVLQRLLNSYADRLPDHFVVVTEKGVRFAKQ